MALMQEIARFFKTGTPPLAPEATVEIFAFMEAAEASKKAGGKAIHIKTLIETSRVKALKKISSGSPK
jgi:hypothetical protein